MRSALQELAESGQGDVRRLIDIDPPEWRLRLGTVRVRFAYIKQDHAILVLRVLPRGMGKRILMEYEYPVYLIDRDGWMYRFEHVQDLRDDLEVTDVADGEYAGWDAKGRPLVPFLRDGGVAGVEAAPQAVAPGEEALTSAIMDYAKVGRPNTPFLPAPEHEPDALFLAADEHVKSGTVLGRLKKWLGG